MFAFYTIYKLISMFSIILANNISGTPPNYELFEVTAFNQHERSLLYEMHIHNESVVFLNGVTNEAAMPMQIVVEECCVNVFQDTLEEFGVEYTHFTLNLRMRTAYEEFFTWELIENWVQTETKKHPPLKKLVIAQTYERREIFTLSLINNVENPIVVIVGGEQGKDWMSVAIILNVINNFFEKNSSMLLLDHYSFYFIPILNPDGYVYSMEKDVFWAKNRRVFFPQKKCHREGFSTPGDFAIGVNLERNWFSEYVSTSADNKCNSVYLGSKPLSEEETEGLATFLNNYAPKIMAFINVIGYGSRLITIPYSHTSQYSTNHGVVMEIIMTACEKVNKLHNVTYFNGPSAKFFYNFSGNCADWVKSNLNIPIVYTVYMKHKDEIIPHLSNVIPLGQQLEKILKETLLVSKEVYGPLFNHNNLKSECSYSMLLLFTINLVFMYPK